MLGNCGCWPPEPDTRAKSKRSSGAGPQAEQKDGVQKPIRPTGHVGHYSNGNNFKTLAIRCC
jgi:hypothetical protein